MKFKKVLGLVLCGMVMLGATACGTVNIFSQIKLAAWLAMIIWQRNLIAQVPFFQGVSCSNTFCSPIEYQQHA